VFVSSEELKEPAAVRYLWADNPDGNLFNGAGLPASPFRTDYGLERRRFLKKYHEPPTFQE
jgi:hypothetical protein